MPFPAVGRTAGVNVEDASGQQEPPGFAGRHMSVLAPGLGFITFLLLLPAREEHLNIDYVNRPGESVRHCYTHFGWQDVLGPFSCGRWAAASAGPLVGLTVTMLSRWSAGRRRSRLTGR